MSHRIHHHALKVQPMQIYFASVSKSPLVTRAVLDQIAEAVEYQVSCHVANLWQGGPCKVAAVSDVGSIPTEDGVCPIILYDRPDQAGVLGWHTYDPTTGRMPGSVFLDPILTNGGTLLQGANSLSCTFSHEAIEAYVDPYVNDYAFVDDATIEPKEACDRTEGDTYEIGGVSVSNFLGPRAFRDGPGPYDWLRLLASPWEIRPGGYVSRIDIATGKTRTLWGDKMPDWQRLLKEEKSLLRISRLSNRRRKA